MSAVCPLKLSAHEPPSCMQGWDDDKDDSDDDKDDDDGNDDGNDVSGRAVEFGQHMSLLLQALR